MVGGNREQLPLMDKWVKGNDTKIYNLPTGINHNFIMKIHGNYYLNP